MKKLEKRKWLWKI